MKTYKKQIPFLLLSLFLISNALILSGQPGGSMERFKDEKITYFNENLKLTENESKEFWPVYEDYHNRNMKVNEDERSLLNYYSCNADAMSEKEIDETIAKFMDLQNKRVELARQYHEKFVKIIGKRKTMQMYAIERQFRMYILDKFRSGKGHGQGYGEGRSRQ